LSCRRVEVFSDENKEKVEKLIQSFIQPSSITFYTNTLYAIAFSMKNFFSGGVMFVIFRPRLLASTRGGKSLQ
jgi:hypothetical protein